jgi:hypothetical protein
MKLYSLDSYFDFGKYKYQSIRHVLKEDNQYVNWCFQKIEWFCVTDDLYNKLDLIIALKSSKHSPELTEILIKMNGLHAQKKEKHENLQFDNFDSFENFHEQETLEELIGGDEQMVDWYNSNELN